MSARRVNNANSIRGPHSALTDFLAANNISAAQIRSTYEERLRGQPGTPSTPADDQENAQPQPTQPEPVHSPQQKKRKRNDEKSKAAAKKAAKKLKKAQGSDESGSEFDEESFAMDMYKKVKPLPGQLENCEICSKRFTVTAYSKTGPEGGLVCSPCGKELAADEKASAKKDKKPVQKRRRKAESNKLDGQVSNGAKSLERLCIEKVADHHLDIEELGDLPATIVDRLSEIFGKRRVLNPRTLPLFIRPDLDTVAIHDAAYLEVDDYKRIFAVAPKITKLILRNACQFKDEVLEYILEKAPSITHFHVYAANLVSDDMWCTFFEQHGHKLESLKLEWLDSTFNDHVLETMVKHCHNLRRLKLKYCRQLTSATLPTIGKLSELTHLSLRPSHPTEPEELIPLIASLGPNLHTLSLENFTDANDTVVDVVRQHCTKLRKFRLTHIDCVSDAALKSLFDSESTAPTSLHPLDQIDLSTARHVDNNNADGPLDAPMGLAADAFAALMAHSGSTLKKINVSSCRHISHAAFCDVFNGDAIYPLLEEIDLSFCSAVDTSVIKGLYRCCPNLKKICAFGCFKIDDVVVPRGIALIGVPRAQEIIEQYGASSIDVTGALSMMGSAMEIDVAA